MRLKLRIFMIYLLMGNPAFLQDVSLYTAPTGRFLYEIRINHDVYLLSYTCLPAKVPVNCRFAGSPEIHRDPIVTRSKTVLQRTQPLHPVQVLQAPRCITSSEYAAMGVVSMQMA